MKTLTRFFLIISLFILGLSIIPKTGLASLIDPEVVNNIIFENSQTSLIDSIATESAIIDFKEVYGEKKYAIIYQKIGSRVGMVLGFVGILAFALIAYGGFLWTTAGGNDEQVSKSKKIVVNTSIALIIVLLSYTITMFITSVLMKNIVGEEGDDGGEYKYYNEAGEEISKEESEILFPN